MPKETTLPVGKLPPDLLSALLQRVPILDPRVLLGPGLGIDCAVLDLGDRALVLKSDPITFASEEIGWYAVQVNANDIATTGAVPRWMLVTVLLPEGKTTPELVERISTQLLDACKNISVSLIGGHTEITYGLERPILSATMIGEVEPARLITPAGAQTGDCILLTKGIPIEATAILAREFPERINDNRHPLHLNEDELKQAINFLHQPGISVLKDAQIAIQAGRIHAMHDPTEGGLWTALWELAHASGHSLSIDMESVHIPAISHRICQILDINPLAAIASGALLIAADPRDVQTICAALESNQIHCSQIGTVLESEHKPQVWQITNDHQELIPYPTRDEIARLYET